MRIYSQQLHALLNDWTRRRIRRNGIRNAEAMSSILLISTTKNKGLQDKTASPCFLWEVNVGSRGENDWRLDVILQMVWTAQHSLRCLGSLEGALR